MIYRSIFFILFVCMFPMSGIARHLEVYSEERLKTLYNSLDPQSVAQHLAFYDLYPESPEGHQALQTAWGLLAQSAPQSPTMNPIEIPFSLTGIDAIVALINKQPNESTPNLSHAELNVIERLAAGLPNRQLKGHWATTEEQVISLDTNDVDLARGLFLSQFADSENPLLQIRSYEATIDLMALQILTKVTLEACPEEKIRAINHFIFEEMRFRFPPHSMYAKDIDLYTFLPSVLDSRRGVCLGVSILYICIAQRLGLTLEMITPPGHIYVRFRNGDKIINIETTARGINLPTEMYLGVETRSLQQRNVKDVIGLAHFNQASTFWQNENYEKAVATYEIAQKYLPDDKLLMELLAYNYLFTGQKEKGEAYLTKVKDHIPEYAITKQTVAEDYLNGKVNADGIKAIFKHVDESRESILEKKNAITSVLEKYPQFRSGLSALAITWLQLHRAGEALEVLKQYHELDAEDPSAEYYLSVLYAQRMDYNLSWEHLKQAEKLVKARNHYPKTIKELRKSLSCQYPE